MKVIIGGTFGHLHRGHIALIKKAFEVGDYIYIGLTTDKYVKRMKPEGEVPNYEERKKALLRFVKDFKKKYEIRELDDKYGPSTTGDYDAIVVSEETVPIALEINRIRKGKKLKPLSIIRIDFVLGFDSTPISTSRITRGEMDRDGNKI